MKRLLLLQALLVLALGEGARAQTRSLDLQGHRGCRGLMPENTLPSMRKALDLGVTTLEMDVVISQDRQVLLSHDPYLNADLVLTPDGQPLAKADEPRYRLYALPYAEIRRYDVGSRGHAKFARQQRLRASKPLLAEVIDSAEAYARRRHRPAPRYNIETKMTPAGDGQSHPAPAEFVALVLAVVQAKGIQDRVILQSFDPRALEEVHRAQPALTTALLVENPEDLAANLRRLSFQPTIYSPHHRLVTADLVRACHQRGMQLIPWTVNAPAELRRLADLGVDGLITDYPDLWPAAGKSR